MKEYHKCVVNDQCAYSNWKDYYKQERRQWNNYEDKVLQGDVMSEECKPSKGYMEWYKFVTNLYLSPNNFLFDPRNLPTFSNIQHTRPSPSTYIQQPFMRN